MTTYVVTINYYNKKHEHRKMLTSYNDPICEPTKAYIWNTLPTLQKNDIYLLEEIEIEKI